ncbi:M50 family metallopeptidase [Bacillus sp. BGMRC 2118]|nr:M50 family metallopeptidase [Bacillus sp. BGMRC 2118]
MSITIIFYTVLGFIITLIHHIYSHPILNFFQNLVILVYTLVHEFAHALFVFMTSGEMEAMELHFEGSGFVIHEYEHPFAAILCTFAGYSVPCLISLGFYVLLDMGYSSIVLILLAAIAVVSLLFIRNWYGFLWLSSFIGLLVLVYSNGSTTFIEHTSMFLSSIVFAGSVYGGWRIFVASFKQPDDAGDATCLAELTYVPAQIWGFIFLCISLITFFLTLSYFHYGMNIGKFLLGFIE